MKKVIVEVDLDGGTTTIEVNGVPGKMCELETKELTAALGGKILEHRHTKEYTLPPERLVGVKQ